MPKSARWAVRAGPIPQILSTARPFSKVSKLASFIRVRPSGFSNFDPNFASIQVDAMPTEQVSPKASLMRFFMVLPSSFGLPKWGSRPSISKSNSSIVEC